MHPTEVHSADDLPSDGMIAVRKWDGYAFRGWHIEGRPDETGFVAATPISMGTGETNGRPRRIHLRFGLDKIVTMPETRR